MRSDARKRLAEVQPHWAEDLKSATDLLLLQLERDRGSSYWADPMHSDSLDGAEAWLLSLRDWLAWVD